MCDTSLENELGTDQLNRSVDSDSLETPRKNNRNDLLLCYLNINSIQNKFEELKDVVIKSRASRFPISIIPGYYLHRNDRKKKGGGILILVSSKIQSKRITIDRKYKTIEPLALEFGLETGNAIFLAIYRPPNNITGNYQPLLARLMYQTVIVTGDLNLNRFKPESTEGKLLLDLEIEQEFHCVITSPTLIQMQGTHVTQSLINIL